MFDKAMRKSIEQYLEPGEHSLDVIIVQGKGMMKATLAGGALGAVAAGAIKDRKAAAEAEDGGVRLSSKMGLAVTDRRLLVFKAGGAMTLKATELLTAMPIDEVDSVEVGKGTVTKPVTVTFHGESFQVEAPRASNADRFRTAFDQAKSGSQN